MKFFLSAGEISGDMHCAYLVNEIKKLSPGSSFIGIGSDMMRAEGVDVRFDISKNGTIGIIETVPNIVRLYSVFLKTKHLLSLERPDVLVLIDSQGFNVPLSQYARSIGIKTIYYITPQEWLWGSEKGVKKIAGSVDLLVSIFKMEHEAYKKINANSIFFGHPLLDIVKPSGPIIDAEKFYGGGDGEKACLCPGSRVHEIKILLPILINTALIIKKKLPQARFCILSASDWATIDIKNILSKFNLSTNIVQSDRYDLISSSDLVLAASGTINLEASILGTPNIMAYKLNPLSYWIGKNILKIDKKIKYFSMPNILIDREIVPEFVQDNADPSLICAKALSLLSGNRRLDNSLLLKILGSPPVIPKIADAILNFTKN